MRLTNTEYEQIVNFIDTCGISFDEAMDRLGKASQPKMGHGYAPTCHQCLEKSGQLPLIQTGNLGTCAVAGDGKIRG